MSRKNTLVYTVLTAKSLATSFIAPATVIRNTDNVSYQINIHTTDSTGTFRVEVSNDYQVNADTNVVTNPGIWMALTLGGGVPNVNAVEDNISISLNQLPFYAIRLAYITVTPGTGTCDVVITTKQIGG